MHIQNQLRYKVTSLFHLSDDNVLLEVKGGTDNHNCVIVKISAVQVPRMNVLQSTCFAVDVNESRCVHESTGKFVIFLLASVGDPVVGSQDDLKQFCNWAHNDPCTLCSPKQRLNNRNHSVCAELEATAHINGLETGLCIAECEDH